jgi:hypothetical protein
LYTSQWGCYIPGQADFVPVSATCREFLDKPPTVPPTNPKPFLNYLQEDGFVAWVNERGLKCVNRVTGLFVGLNKETGVANEPGPSVTPPDSQCWGACWYVTDTSDMCFECVMQQVEKNPSLCPSVDVNNPDDTSLLQESTNCHTCLALQSGNIFKNDANGDPVADNEAQTDKLYKCITGSVGGQLISTPALIALIVVGVFLVVLALILGLWYGVYRPRHLKRQKQLDRLRQKIEEE